MKENLQIQFVHCPKCNGSGQTEEEKACPECSELGLGTFFRGKFLYWKLDLSNRLISLKKIERTINWIINALSLVFAVSGFASLAFWFWKNMDSYEKGSLFFWEHKSHFVLLFWIGIIFLLFIVYRINEITEKKQKINNKKFTKEEMLSENLPNNWKELQIYKNKINTVNGYSEQSLKILEESFALAKKMKNNIIVNKHILLVMLKNNEVRALFARLNTPAKTLEDRVKSQLNKESEASKLKKIRFSENAKEALILGYIDALENKQKEVKILNILSYIFEKDEDLKELLYDLNLNVDKIKNVIEWFNVNDKMVEAYQRYKKMSRFKPSSNMDRAYTSVETPILNHYSYDLTLSAKWGRLDFCVGRDEEIEDAFKAIESGSSGVLLVGPPGVGKRTVISGIAERMVLEEVPEAFKDKRLLELDISRLVSGADASKAQERLTILVDEIRRAGNIILFIENIENIIGISAGGEESLELSEVLAGFLDRREIYCLGVATNENYTKYIEKETIGQTMTKVDIEEPKGNQAIQIVQSKIGFIEIKYKIFFSYHAIEESVVLSDKYMHDKYLPEKAIKILESTAINVSKRCKQDSKKCICMKDDVAEIISEITKIPTEKVSEDESEKLLNLEEEIHKRMINQKEAVKMVSDSLRRARANIRSGNRPIANFLFLGPTGVGKTELAKTISEVYFGDENYMIRIDMSEYQSPESISKMIGDEDSRGYLTEAVRNKPFSLILLDEFEKANPKVLNLFLQVMDDGRLTDGQGRTIDFTNAIIIATSNAGALFIQEKILANQQISDIKEELIQNHLTKVMKPELINRFDGVIVFTPLTEENLIDITKLMLKKIENKLSDQKIYFEVNEEGVKKLAHEGYDPKFGARPLRRLLQNKIENIIAEKMLSKELSRRDRIIINSEAEIQIEKAKEI